MASLSRTTALACKPRSEVVDTPSGSVIVRGLTAAERGELFDAWAGVHGGLKAGASARVAVWCCLNEDGTQVFLDSDLMSLMYADNAMLEPIMKKCLELSGLFETATEAAKKN